MSRKAVLHRRLTARILLFLTLALVPLGLISVIQNQRLNQEIRQRSDLTLLALTEQAASGERRAIQRTFGAAQVLARTIDFMLENPSACSEVLQQQANEDTMLAFVGFIGVDGMSTCSSDERSFDFSGVAAFETMMEDPKQRLTVSPNGRVTGEAVLVFSQPHYRERELRGFVVVSMRLDDVVSEPDFFGAAEPITLITFNAAGELLTTEGDRQLSQALLPKDIALADLAVGFARTFQGSSRSGRDLTYSVVPIIPDVAYAVGLWRAEDSVIGSDVSQVWTTLLPFAMWLASLFVSWFIIDRFVIDRIKHLNRAMGDFAERRTLSAPPHSNLSSELENLDVTFRSMAEKILRDEATMEDQLREKSILLKEIHHRVKNNLQIISSIMNMQVRKAQADETRQSLTQVQDRILGLSQVHQTLYQAEALTEIDAAALIENLVDQSRALANTTEGEVDVQLDLDQTAIFPDQAVPFIMLVSECMSNAMKYIGGAPRTIVVSLKKAEKGHVVFTLENSVGPDTNPPPEPGHLAGLGRQLIRAFTAQLNGTLSVSEPDGRYRIEVTFAIETPKAVRTDF